MLKIKSLPAHSRSMNWRKIIFFTFWKLILFEQTEDRWRLELKSKVFFVFLEIVSVWCHFGNMNFQPCVHLVVTNSVNIISDDVFTSLLHCVNCVHPPEILGAMLFLMMCSPGCNIIHCRSTAGHITKSVSTPGKWSTDAVMVIMEI